MISAATSSLVRIAPTSPGSRWLRGGIRLNRCVACRAPAAIAARDCSSVAPECPSDTRRPPDDEVSNQIERAVELGSERHDADVVSGAVDLRDDVAAIEIMIAVAPGAPSKAAASDTTAGCAPRYSGLMKLLSRCAGSTRAPAVELARRAATARNTCRSASGAHATVVGQNAVTPRFARRSAIAQIAVAAVERIDAVEAMNVDVDEAREHDVAAQIDRIRAPAAPIAPGAPIAVAPDRISTIRSPSSTSVPSDLDASRQHEIGASQDDHER